jgi:hypothetical protein
MIALPSRPSDLLDWNIETEETDILWRFEQGLEERGFPLEDEMRFSALALALEKFSKEIWPRFQERTAGAVLYRGRADFDSLFSWTERQRENWAVWKEERPQASEAHMKRLFCADAYVHYFQMLAHKLPDEMPIYLLLDVSGLGSEAERHQLVSRERFAHFHAAVRGLARTNGKVWNEAIEESPKPPCALVFPEEARCSGDILRKLDRAMEKIEAPFRVIGEPYLTEEWEGVDVLYILPEAVSPQGERMLKGFCAAGGTVFAVE